MPVRPTKASSASTSRAGPVAISLNDSASFTPQAFSAVSPIANKIKAVREKKLRLYVIVKQTLLAFMNGAMPQVALEHGRKTISAYERPSIDEVEQETLSIGAGAAAEPAREAA